MMIHQQAINGSDEDELKMYNVDEQYTTTAIAHFDEDPVVQQASSLNSIEQELVTDTTRYNFPDPGSSNLFVKRFFVGATYPLKAVLLCFTESFIWMSVLEGLIVAFLIYLTFSVGCVCGYFTANGIWRKPGDREWHLLWKFIPYNWFGMWVALVITCCLFYVSLFFVILFVPFRAAIDTSCKRLSALVERRMKGQEIDMKLILWGEEGSRSGDPTPACCTPQWFIRWAKNYFLSIVHGYFNQFKSIIKQQVKRYASRFIQFIFTNALTFVLGFFIPGIGFIVSIILFIVRFFAETAMLGLDVVMDRKGLGFFESERTVWNNFSLVAGLGFGLVIVAIIPGGIFLLYPVTIISATRLYIHLDYHERTGDWDEFWDLPGCLTCSFHPQNTCFVKIISRRNRKFKSVKRRMREQQQSQQAMPVEIETTIDHMDDYTL